MSQTRILCENCGAPQCYCNCEPKPLSGDKPPSVPLQPVVRWDVKVTADGQVWSLLRRDGTRAATVWDNGVWHTWDADGIGGENSAEASVEIAKAEAVLSALNQGFLTSNPSRQGAGHLVHGTLDGVVQPSESDLKK